MEAISHCQQVSWRDRRDFTDGFTDRGTAMKVNWDGDLPPLKQA